jgi:cytochrome c5
MKYVLGKTGIWLWVTIATAAIAFAAGQNTEQSNSGERIMNRSCLGCHDLRPIQTQALDADGWTNVVNSMIEKGAEVNMEERAVLVDYLAWNHGPLPEGAGKTVLLNQCTICHDIQRIKLHPNTPEGWNDTLSAMLNEGAMLSDEEFNAVLIYLVRNFRQ